MAMLQLAKTQSYLAKQIDDASHVVFTLTRVKPEKAKAFCAINIGSQERFDVLELLQNRGEMKSKSVAKLYVGAKVVEWS